VVRKLGSQVTYANVVATLALFLALGGGAYAVTAKKNSVKSSSIKNGQVLNPDLGSGAVNGPKVADGSLSGADVADGSLGGSDTANPQPTGFGDGIGGSCFATPGLMCADDASNRWSNQPPAPQWAWPAYYLDSDGFVHLQGHVEFRYVTTWSPVMFTLPIALKPAGLLEDGRLKFLAHCTGCSSQTIEITVFAHPSSTPADVSVQVPSSLNPGPLAANDIHNGDIVSLNGISWRTD
jgi:hypothetical protein